MRCVWVFLFLERDWDWTWDKIGLKTRTDSAGERTGLARDNRQETSGKKRNLNPKTKLVLLWVLYSQNKNKNLSVVFLACDLQGRRASLDKSNK
jgi:hypothetical protein